MNLFDLFVKIGVKDEASAKLKSIAGGMGKGLQVAAKAGVAAVGAVATGVAAITTQAVKSYAEYEQLVGGVETLFKDSAGTVQQYAAQAYQTAGFSANEYMETVTSFSASLLQSLEGDTAAAAEYADTAITDMSDNANKMGSDIETLKTAYAGFAKGQFMLLDNLKLGYGGTKEEMQRLLDDAEKLSGVKYDLSSYSDIVQAIHVVQGEMEISGRTAEEAAEIYKRTGREVGEQIGTTAKEATKTISGSVAAMKSSWKNLVTGIADENADFETLVDQFVETVGVTAENIIPRVEIALEGAGKLVDRMIPVIIDKVPHIVNDMLPKILESGISIIKKLVQGIMDNQDTIADGAVNTITTLIDGITDMLPDIVVTGVSLIGKLAVGLIQAIPDLILKIPEIVKAIIQGFKDEGPNFLQIGKDIVNGIKDGILKVWDSLVSWFSGLWDRLFGNRNVNVNVNQTSNIDGAHASGLDYVPFDGYIARLHKGERVLTADENRRSSRGGSGVQINQYIYSEAKTAADLEEEAVYNAEKAVLGLV